MAIAHSKVTSQGQISVPVEVRKKLGIGPGSVIEWGEESGQVVVRRMGRFSSEDVHAAIFGDRAATRGRKSPPSLDQLKAGIAQHLGTKHARR